LPIFFPRFRSQPKTRAPDKVTVSLGYPAIFHWTVLVVLLGLLIFAAFKQMVPLLAATVFLLVLVILSRFWSRYALRSLSCRISTGRDRAFPDEEIELTFELVNKGLPLPWLEIEVEFPYRLTTGKRSLSPYTWERRRWVTAIARGQVITWKHTLEAKARGDYRLGPLRLRSGDMFGLFPKELALSHFQSLLVYPRIFPLNKLNLPLRALFGEKVGPRSIYEDTSRVAGARDYRYDDPLKRIHWQASAAHSKLQTRQYESSTSLSLLLILDVHSFPEENEEFEQAVSTVASLAYEASRQGFAVGLITNSEPEVQIAIGNGQNHLMQILEALARITAKSRIALYEQMDRFRTILPVGATLVVVTRTTTPTLASLARQLEQDGHSLLWISTEQATEQKKGAIVSLNGRAYS
jgi:uncharacterized protein (DUF58 family)